MRFVISFVIALVVPSLGWAAVPTPAEIRGLIHKGSYADAQFAIEETVAAYHNADIDADALRKVFMLLSTSDPAVVEFVGIWATHEPENAQALIARAWSLYNASQNVGTASNQYSRDIERQMFFEARELATEAFNYAPDLIPASDAMVRRIADPEAGPDPFVVAKAVMEAQPNWGTILRSLNLVSGADALTARDFCVELTSSLGPRAEAMMHRCLLRVSTSFRVQGLDDWALSRALAVRDPNLEIEHLAAITYFATPTDLTEDHVRRIERKFRTLEVDPFELVYLWDLHRVWTNRVLQLYFPLLQQPYEFQRAYLERAQSFLENDP